MKQIIKSEQVLLPNGETDNIFNLDDFSYLVGEYLGQECKNYFDNLIDDFMWIIDEYVSVDKETLKFLNQDLQSLGLPKVSIHSSTKITKSKKYINAATNIDTDILHDAMELCGYTYNDIESYDGYQKYDYMGGTINFDSDQETLEWLLYVDMEDIELENKLLDFLYKYKTELKIDELFPYYFNLIWQEIPRL